MLGDILGQTMGSAFGSAFGSAQQYSMCQRQSLSRMIIPYTPAASPADRAERALSELKATIGELEGYLAEIRQTEARIAAEKELLLKIKSGMTDLGVFRCAEKREEAIRQIMEEK